VISLAGRFPTVIERLSMLKLPEAIFGTWQNDAARTLAEIKRHLRPDHPKLHEFTLPERLIPLTVCYTPDSVLYTYRGEQVRARFRILAYDEFSLVSEVETTWLMTNRFGTSTFFRRIAIGSRWIWIGDLSTGNFSLKSAGHQQFKRSAANRLTAKWRLKTKIYVADD